VTVLTVRLLVPGTSTGTTELLGLHAAGVGDEEGAVLRHKGTLELVLGLLVDILLVVGDKTLGEGLADGVDLRDVATTSDSDADVKASELVKADNEERLEDLHTDDLGLNEREGHTVDLDQALSLLDVGNGGGRLLLAESLDARESNNLRINTAHIGIFEKLDPFQIRFARRSARVVHSWEYKSHGTCSLWGNNGGQK